MATVNVSANTDDSTIPGDYNLNNSPSQQLPALMISVLDCTKEPDNEECSGVLIIPGEEDSKNTEKQCQMICRKFGERCTIDPRGNRRCMKICEDFGEECF